MPRMLFTGTRRFDEFAIWEQEMKRWAVGFSIQVYHTVPASSGKEKSIDIEYTLPEGSYGRFERCPVCQEFLLGRELPEEPPVLTLNRRRLGT